jgi:cytochrome c biogenesis protein ResB
MSSFSIGGIVIIVIGVLLIITIAGLIISRFVERNRLNSLAKSNSILTKKKLFSETVQHYLIATRVNIQVARKSINYITNITATSPASTRRNLVDIEC